MTKTRLVTLLLALALAFAGTSAVLAEDLSEEEAAAAAAFDAGQISEGDEDELLIIYALLRDKLAEAGVVEEDSMGAIEWLDGEFLSQERSGDDEFGQAEEDEPELGDEEEEE
jgi:hypothetical protein